MTRLIKIYRLLLDVTAIGLLIMVYLYILTGYEMLQPGILSSFTLGIINYRLSIILHGSLLSRLVLLALTTLHGLTGFTLFAYRVKSRGLRKALIVFIHVLFIALLLYILLIEYSINNVPVLVTPV